MAIFWWIIIISLFILSFVGIVFPIIPGLVSLWAAFLLYHFFVDNGKLTLFFWLIMVAFSILLIGTDMIANSYFVKKFGGSKIAETFAAIATIVGSFVFPPFGIIIVPLLTVLLLELLIQKSFTPAIKISFATMIGFLASSTAKIIIQLAMIIWFVITIII